MTPGFIVTSRNRIWVLLPSNQEDLHFLRPLTGATEEIVPMQKWLAGDGCFDGLGMLMPNPTSSTDGANDWCLVGLARDVGTAFGVI